MRGFVVILDFHILHKISYQILPKWFLLQFVQGKPHFGSRLPWLLSKVLLLPVWVWLVLPSTAYSKGMLPLDLWCQASLQGLPERQHLGQTVHCWGWSDRIVSWMLGPWWRGWEICAEWGLVAQRLTTDSCPVVTGHIDPQRSPVDCQPPSSPLGVGAEVAEPDNGPLAACHLRWWVEIPRRWQA